MAETRRPTWVGAMDASSWIAVEDDPGSVGDLRIDDGQREAELGTTVGSRTRPDAPAHGVDESAADEQPDARATRAVAARAPVEQLEQLVRLVGGDARSAVEYPHADRGVRSVRGDGHRRLG